MKSLITIAVLAVSASAYASAIGYEDAHLVLPQQPGNAAPVIELKNGLRLPVSPATVGEARNTIHQMYQNQGDFPLVYQDAMVRKFAVKVNGQCIGSYYGGQYSNYNQYGYSPAPRLSYQACQQGSQFVIQFLAKGKTEETSQEESPAKPAAVETNSYSNQSVLIEIPQLSAQANGVAPVVIVDGKRLNVSLTSSPQVMMAFQQMYSNQGGFQMIIQDQMTRRFKARVTGSCLSVPAAYNQYPAPNGPCASGNLIILDSLTPVTSSESAGQDQVEGGDERSAGDDLLDELEKPISPSTSTVEG